MKEERRNKWCEGNHVPPPTGRPMSSKSPSNGHLGRQPCLLSLFFTAEHDAKLFEISLLWTPVSFPSCNPSQPPAYTLQRQSGKETKPSCLCKHCSAIAKTLVCCQHCFSHKSKTQHLMGFIKRVNSIPAIPSTLSCLACSDGSYNGEGEGFGAESLQASTGIKFGKKTEAGCKNHGLRSQHPCQVIGWLSERNLPYRPPP